MPERSIEDVIELRKRATYAREVFGTAKAVFESARDAFIESHAEKLRNAEPGSEEEAAREFVKAIEPLTNPGCVTACAQQFPVGSDAYNACVKGCSIDP